MKTLPSLLSPFLLSTLLLLVFATTSAQVVTTGDPTLRGGTPVMRALIVRLDSLGYFRWISRDSAVACKQEMLRSNYPLACDAAGRMWHTDAENLAEGGVPKFFRRIDARLRMLGVVIDSISHEFEGNRPYVVTVNGVRYRMYTVVEMEEDFWLMTQFRALAVLNHLLEQAGAEERFYNLYGGNDAMAILMTPAMYEAISASGILTGYNLPDRIDPENLEDTREQ